MRTTGGLKVSEIESRQGLTFITFTGFSFGKQSQTIEYVPSHQFDMIQPGSEREAEMAQRVITEVLSDLSDAPEASTVLFGLDGAAFEIDLTDEEAGDLREALAPYLAVARKAKGGRKRAAAQQSGPSAKVIREWAQENGHEVPDRGRIPAEVREAYNEANPESK